MPSQPPVLGAPPVPSDVASMRPNIEGGPVQGGGVIAAVADRDQGAKGEKNPTLFSQTCLLTLFFLLSFVAGLLPCFQW